MNELPPSYWFAHATSHEEADVVIVGAGLVGASTAWWAARAGYRVIVLEAQRVAAGARAGTLCDGYRYSVAAIWDDAKEA